MSSPGSPSSRRPSDPTEQLIELYRLISGFSLSNWLTIQIFVLTHASAVRWVKLTDRMGWSTFGINTVFSALCSSPIDLCSQWLVPNSANDGADKEVNPLVLKRPQQSLVLVIENPATLAKGTRPATNPLVPQSLIVGLMWVITLLQSTSLLTSTAFSSPYKIIFLDLNCATSSLFKLLPLYVT